MSMLRTENNIRGSVPNELTSGEFFGVEAVRGSAVERHIISPAVMEGYGEKSWAELMKEFLQDTSINGAKYTVGGDKHRCHK